MDKVIEQWLKNKIAHKEIEDYLKLEFNIKSIAIYGAGTLGEMLYDDIMQFGDIEVSYFIDKNAESLYYGIDDMNIFSLEELDTLKKVDMIIVTPYKEYEQIKCDLEKKLLYKTNIISLDDIIWKVE